MIILFLYESFKELLSDIIIKIVFVGGFRGEI